MGAMQLASCDVHAAGESDDVPAGDKQDDMLDVLERQVQQHLPVVGGGAEEMRGLRGDF